MDFSKGDILPSAERGAPAECFLLFIGLKLMAINEKTETTMAPENDELLREYCVLKVHDNTAEARIQGEPTKEALTTFLNQKICRYLPIEFFIKDAKGSKLTLSHFSQWSDPYEAATLKQSVLAKTTSGSQDFHLNAFLNAAYGQSWMTELEEKEVFWRLYSKGGSQDYVRVTATIRNLLQGLILSADNDSKKTSDSNLVPVGGDTTRFQEKQKPHSFCIGKVRYIPHDEMKSFLTKKGFDSSISSVRGFAENYLLIKRSAFDLEKEVRIVYDLACLAQPIPDALLPVEHVSLPVGKPFHEIFEKVQFSPFLCKCKKKDYRKRLLALGYKKSQITESCVAESPEVLLSRRFYGAETLMSQSSPEDTAQNSK